MTIGEKRDKSATRQRKWSRSAIVGRLLQQYHFLIPTSSLTLPLSFLDLSNPISVILLSCRFSFINNPPLLLLILPDLQFTTSC
ncbi:hypothetical protein RIF29_41846 [Crotalaria pallida]|uniref:Uncharacterized protein n=1 Tax=Crotalaria pallida TaxID=3830 RepID=A0AAN9E837_CROPI